MPIAIVVHGGAGELSSDRIEDVQAGCREAALIGWNILRNGGSALDAVEATVQALEDNPNFNAGTGSCLNSAGTIEMDAALMEGNSLQIGAVAGVERIKNPIALARLVFSSPQVMLIGRGAMRFAIDNGMELYPERELHTERQVAIWQRLHDEHQAALEEPVYHRREIRSIQARDEPEQSKQSEPSETAHAEGEEHPDNRHGTVGAVALDEAGNLATATSTGGYPYKLPGRVGDSPLVGAGFYADENAAISCTGNGEDFTRLLMAKRAADNVAKGMTAREAAEATIAVLGAKAQGTGGLIIVDRFGNVGFSWNSQNMVHAYLTNDMVEPTSGV